MITCSKLRCHLASPIPNLFLPSADLQEKSNPVAEPKSRKQNMIITNVGWPHEKCRKRKHLPPGSTRNGSDELWTMWEAYAEALVDFGNCTIHQSLVNFLPAQFQPHRECTGLCAHHLSWQSCKFDDWEFFYKKYVLHIKKVWNLPFLPAWLLVFFHLVPQLLRNFNLLKIQLATLVQDVQRLNKYGSN